MKASLVPNEFTQVATGLYPLTQNPYFPNGTRHSCGHDCWLRWMVKVGSGSFSHRSLVQRRSTQAASPQSTSSNVIDVRRVVIATTVDGGSSILIWGYATIYTSIYGLRYVSYSLDTDNYLIALRILESIPAVVATTYVAACTKAPKLATFFTYGLARTGIVMLLSWRILPCMEIVDYGWYFVFLAAVFCAGIGISWFLKKTGLIPICTSTRSL